jgi:hypothetical protein
MPAKKTRPRAKRAGDQAYGAGESSGKKAKLLPKPEPVATLAESFPPSQALAIQVVNTHWHPNPAQAQVLQNNDPYTQPPVPSHSLTSNSSYYRAKTHLY